MTFITFRAAQGAALRHPETAAGLVAAAQNILPLLEAGQPFDTGQLRTAMTAAFGASDAEGAWDWKAAYDACEGAQVLLLRAYGRALMTRAGSSQQRLAMWERIARRTPTHTRRSESGQSLQQFSTPLPLAYVAAQAACIRSGDMVLEPSAGTGMLAIHAELAGAMLVLNELDCGRAEYLAQSFPGLSVTRHDAAAIDDRLDGAVQPDVVLMNPPFSAVAGVERRMRDAALRHLASALTRLRDGGRLVAIVGANCSPEAPAWRDAFGALQQTAALRFSAAISGRVYAKHGTTMPTRLLVFDKVPHAGGTALLERRGEASDLATLLQWVETDLPERPDPSPPPSAAASPISIAISSHSRGPARLPVGSSEAGGPVGDDQSELVYSTREWQSPEGRLGDTIYEPYSLQSLCIDGAQPHPTALVQSAAMASVAPPRPSYRPNLPMRLVADGILSDAQLESVIYAGEAHSGHLSGAWAVNETWDTVSAASDDMEDAIRFRRGWFLGDGTGAGKGRQVAGIILDNWLKGRRRAVWLSVSDRLLEDAQRDWAALGQERLLVTPLSRFRQGTPIRLAEGILFAPYATLRSQARGDKASRVEQIVEWLGRNFDGVIVFDEAHAMANAAGGKGARGEQKPSQQGRAGLRLQHALPDARIVYVSATGATTVQNLAYAQRLGLWGGTDFPFASRSEFVAAIEEGGVAAMEVLARDLKALGLYAARSLSFDGVEYELLEHQLTDEQRRIYDAYAGAFQIIHNNLDAAMEAAGVTSSLHGTLNPQTKSAARSAFESTKQRFFNHLITAMQTPATIASIALASRIEGAVASGTFEMGLETLRAESFTVTGRQTIYTHPGTGAQTQLLTIERKDRIAPLLLADALDLVQAPGGELVVNAHSGRASVKLRARSLIDDDGSVHRRFALQRPLEKMRVLAEDFEDSHWKPATAQAFEAAWNAELGELPDCETSTLHIVAGLLLPIWKRLPKESTRVYRLQTDAGERIIGRKVAPAWAASVTGNGAVQIDVAEAWRMLGAGDIALEIAEGQTLRRVRAMNDWRIELSGFNDLGVERLKAMGLISEIVSWKLKLYVPAGAAGADVFAALVDRFPIVRVQDRKAA